MIQHKHATSEVMRLRYQFPPNTTTPLSTAISADMPFFPTAQISYLKCHSSQYLNIFFSDAFAGGIQTTTDYRKNLRPWAALWVRILGSLPLRIIGKYSRYVEVRTIVLYNR